MDSRRNVVCIKVVERAKEDRAHCEAILDSPKKPLQLGKYLHGGRKQFEIDPAKVKKNRGLMTSGVTDRPA